RSSTEHRACTATYRPLPGDRWVQFLPWKRQPYKLTAVQTHPKRPHDEMTTPPVLGIGARQGAPHKEVFLDQAMLYTAVCNVVSGFRQNNTIRFCSPTLRAPSPD